MSGKLRGDEARAVVVSAPLHAVFSVKRDQKASFRNAKVMRLGAGIVLGKGTETAKQDSCHG